MSWLEITVPTPQGDLNTVSSALTARGFSDLVLEDQAEFEAFLEGLKMHRIKAQMRNAAKKGLTFHLWWHPHNVGVRTDFHMRQLEELFRYFQQLQKEYGMVSRNMGEAAREVLGKRGN